MLDYVNNGIHYSVWNRIRSGRNLLRIKRKEERMELEKIIGLKVKIRNLKDLLRDMIRIEEYELCGQLRDIIGRRERELKELESGHS
jgi:protein-arginine kinase activator protein McsA